MTRTIPFIPLRLLGAVLLAMFAFASPVMADDRGDDNEFGSYILEGSCDDLGDEADELGELDARHHADDDDDDRHDQERVWERLDAEGDISDRFWSEDDDADMALDELIDGEHVITIHENDDADSDMIACGAITGDLDENNGLTVDLEEHEGSGYAGRAYLTPDEDDDADDDEADVFIGVWKVEPAGV